jgi:hypothetical protein
MTEHGSFESARGVASAVVLSFVLALSVGCMDSAPPVAPAGPPVYVPTPSPVVPGPPPAFPPLTRPGEIYASAADLRDPVVLVQRWGFASRYVLYEDSTFALQFSSVKTGFLAYLGRYVRTDTVMTFNFNDENAAGAWRAVGTLHGDSISVSYNIVMYLADFVDDVYVRSRVAP